MRVLSENVGLGGRLEHLKGGLAAADHLARQTEIGAYRCQISVHTPLKALDALLIRPGTYM